MVYAKSTLTSPNDLFALSTGGQGASRQLTRENVSLSKEVAWPTPETLTARGAGGTPIQYRLLKPPGFDPARKYPVVFLIHGGPQGAWEDAWSSRWNPSLWAAQGWIIAAPNPRGSTGFGQTFVDEISQDWGGKVMTDLDGVFDAVAGMPFVDNKKMGIAGASYGGYAVNWIVGHTDRFRVAVSHDGVFNLESMALATEELWFTEWEFGGPAWSDQARAELREVVAASACFQDQDPDAHRHQRAGLPRPGGSGSSVVHGPAQERRSVRSARVSGRGTLGAAAAEQPALARGGLRVAEEALERRRADDAEVSQGRVVRDFSLVRV